MELTTPFAILRDVLKNTEPKNPHCFIDDTEVSLKECGSEGEEKLEVRGTGLWYQECDEHPTRVH